MHIQPALDRGNVDSRSEWRVDFQVPEDSVTHLVDGRGRIWMDGDELASVPSMSGDWLLGQTPDGVVHCVRLVKTMRTKVIFLYGSAYKIPNDFGCK